MAKFKFKKMSMDQAKKMGLPNAFAEVKYCVFCGKPLILSSVDEDNNKVNIEWEQKFSAHYNCYLKRLREQGR